MIVNIAAWLYLIQGALGLWSLSWGPFGFRMSMENLVTFAVSVAIAAMGYGLLKRDPRARWWALGSSLIGWIVGGLLIVGGIAGLIYLAVQEDDLGKSTGQLLGAMFAGDLGSFVFFIAVIIVLLFVASTVLLYKLFWYLCSREGCEEFGVQYGSAGTVLASVGAWIAVTVAEATMSGGGGAQMALALMSASSDREERVANQQELDSARREARAALEREEELKREAVLEEARQALENSQAEEAERAGATPEEYAPTSQPPETAPPDSEAPVPVLGSAAADEEESESKPNKILKCRDKAGAVSYTQGYCPPGTTLVDTPRYE